MFGTTEFKCCRNFSGAGKICTFVIGRFITGFFPQATSDCKSVFKF